VASSPGRSAESVVVYTCITGGYDIPLESPWADRCPHLCFTDQPTYRTSTWTLLPMGMEQLDPVRRSRHPKLLPHRYLPDHDISIWIDGSARLLEDPLVLARRALADADFALARHPKRSCAFEEARVCSARLRDRPEVIDAQMRRYAAAGLPRDSGLWEGTVILRRHRRPQVQALMEAWWQELLAGSARDQISLAYLLWRNPIALTTLPPRNGPDAFYRLRRHHVQRSRLDRARIQLIEGIQRLRRRLAPVAAPRI
jgi:hypothetical protein